MKRYIITIHAVFLIFLEISGQERPRFPEIGTSMPAFTLQNIQGWTMTKATLEDFKGKWLMLDFWNKTCGMCIAAFPYNSEIQQEMGDRVQVMQVGIEDKENAIRPMWARFKRIESLQMPSAFDSALANKLDIAQCPYIILIDDKGIVRAITISLNKENLKSIMAGDQPKLIKAYRTNEDYVEPALLFPYDINKPFLVNNNGAQDSNFIFRSVLTKWALDDGHAQKWHPSIKEAAVQGKFEAIGIDLLSLYKAAYISDLKLGRADSLYGKFYSEPILEVKDPSVFDRPRYGGDKNWWAYSLIMPKVHCTEVKIQTAIQKDLQVYFGYEAGIETRKCPYYRLIARPGAREKLKTKGGKPFYQSDGKSSYLTRNVPLKYFFETIQGWNSGVYVNETGITDSVDISLDCLIIDLDNSKKSNLSELRKQLQRYGLDLIKDEKDMQALVLKDPKLN
jgi:alkyl hydroperoxide reductase subunit AhpC